MDSDNKKSAPVGAADRIPSLFEGDILLQYALLGVVALWMVFWNPRLLLALGVLLLCIDTAFNTVGLWPDAAAEKTALSAPAAAPARIEYEKYWQEQRDAVTAESRVMANGSMGDILAHRFVNADGLNTEALLDPVLGLRYAALQYLPMMLIGAALYRLGFFAGAWNRRRMLGWGIAGMILRPLPR